MLITKSSILDWKEGNEGVPDRQTYPQIAIACNLSSFHYTIFNLGKTFKVWMTSDNIWIWFQIIINKDEEGEREKPSEELEEEKCQLSIRHDDEGEGELSH